MKALRYYERIGLIAPARLPNGYRTFTATDLELIQQVTTLTRLGLSVRGTRPFIECLKQGHAHGDECPESLAAYHQEIGSSHMISFDFPKAVYEQFLGELTAPERDMISKALSRQPYKIVLGDDGPVMMIVGERSPPDAVTWHSSIKQERPYSIRAGNGRHVRLSRLSILRVGPGRGQCQHKRDY